MFVKGATGLYLPLLLEQNKDIFTGQNVDKPKRRQPKRRQTETRTTKTSTNRNVDRPKRRQAKSRQTEASTNQTSTDPNVDKPKRRLRKMSTNQNVDRPKRRHSILVADGHQFITMVREWIIYKPINDGNCYKFHGHINASLSVTSMEIWNVAFPH